MKIFRVQRIEKLSFIPCYDKKYDENSSFFPTKYFSQCDNIVHRVHKKASRNTPDISKNVSMSQLSVHTIFVYVRGLYNPL